MELDDASRSPNWWRRRNWWKIGFFVMFVFFEFTREVAVLASDPNPKIAIFANVGSIAGYTTASGRWIRIDGGGPMVPSATRITCDQSEGRCVEATASIFNGYVSEPTVDTFHATFAPEAVSYENDIPQCANYSVRIDLKLKKVFAVRERKPKPENETCQKLEPRIEMTLGDGYQKDENPFRDHFVPLIRSMRWFFR